jgi:DMSO/TMAO reductase YedYZ molybdopterin-dependent catalytic subunit
VEVRMKKTLHTILLVAITILIAGCSAPEQTDFAQLKSVEVKEYEGEKLDSLTDAFDTSIKGTQHINQSEYKLIITGLVDNRQELTYDEVLAFDSYKKVVTLNCVEGWSAKILWEGILVEDLLEQAGFNLDATTVIFHAEDGYTTSLPLDYIMNNDILLAYKMNDVTLPPSKGFPFQLIAEQKWGYKWAKWVTKITVSKNENYRGYWEQRGWDNDADLDENPREGSNKHR